MSSDITYTLDYYFIFTFFIVIMRSLHDVHKINSYRAGHVCLSVRMIRQENRLTDLDEIWYGRYAIVVCPKIVFPNVLQS
jgi:hypothetical protein